MTNGPPAPKANPEFHGHAAALAALSHALTSDRLPHAWLLGGRQGIGKATLAYRFARALLAGPSAVDQTLTLAVDHPVFRQVAAGSHPDLRVIQAERDARTGKVKPEITVDTVRAATASLHTTAAEGGRRVILIDEVERLNRNAANALLKPLEEPPAGAVLILISHRPGKIAPTLRSRCAKLLLGPLDEAVIVDALAKHDGDVSSERRQAAARLAQGSLGRALELADGDWIGLYQRLVQCLVTEPADQRALQEVMRDLARRGGTHGFAAPIGLIQELMGRLVRARHGRLGPPIFAEEPELIGRLADLRPLDRWASLWEKIARLAAAVDGLNLDHTQALLQILTRFTPVSGPGEEPSIGATPFGGQDVLA